MSRHAMTPPTTWTPSPMPSATPESSTPRIVLGVAPVLTPDATRFVGALTLSALASEPARTALFGDPATPIPHTHLGQGADLVLVVPATAHLIARYAMGLADDLLTATLLATRAPVLLCPAMHTEMWEHPSVQENLATLRRRGVMVLEPESGPLAGGDAGTGRLADPERIVELARAIVLGFRGPLSGRRVLVSAGGTREAIDPVRVITNRSSGRQGYALAEVAARLGAEVTLVSAVERDLALDVARRIRVVDVASASQMREAVLARSRDCDVVIMAAAVSDFTVRAASEKLKRASGPPRLEFSATADVVAELVDARHPGQVIVAFAAETTDVMANARSKLA